MQLDLFEDNRPGILLNIADEYLRDSNFESALTVFTQIQEEYPHNRQAAQLGALVKTWHATLAQPVVSNCKPGQLGELLNSLETIHHPPLKTAILKILLKQLQAFPNPDSIYHPPRFHRGYLLLQLGRYTEAAASFRNALLSQWLEYGRFLAWRADAMTLDGKADDALSLYLQAFLTDPASVDVGHFKHRSINDLLLDLSCTIEGIDKDDEIAWLPVWGWLRGLFALPLQQPPEFEELEDMIKNNAAPVPRLWYDLLTIAEYRRTVQRDDRQLADSRRWMKQLHEEMFESYMKKIRGSL